MTRSSTARQNALAKAQEIGVPIAFSPRELSMGSGLGLTFIYEALRRGELRGFRIGRRGWRIDVHEARSWLTQLRNSRRTT